MSSALHHHQQVAMSCWWVSWLPSAPYNYPPLSPQICIDYVTFTKFYKEGGVSPQAEPDLNSAWKILEKATKVNFKAVENLAKIWCIYYEKFSIQVLYLRFDAHREMGT